MNQVKPEYQEAIVAGLAELNKHHPFSTEQLEVFMKIVREAYGYSATKENKDEQYDSSRVYNRGIGHGGCRNP